MTKADGVSSEATKSHLASQRCSTTDKDPHSNLLV